ncbi:MAG: Nif3-like dinuclear metal center hexameric protein [Promethearchaeota archaeon]
MDAKMLFKQLDQDFDLDNCEDKWVMDFNEYISENFKQRHMGLLVDNTEEVDYVYTAVFPSDKVLKEILEVNKKNSLLLTHHPMVWDIRNTPRVFFDISLDLLEKFKQRQISIYTLHTPLDKNGEYSTTVNWAKGLEITQEKEFFEYYGVKVGIFGKTKFQRVQELAKNVSKVVSHEIKLFEYGNDKIKDCKVALVAGGGNEIDVLKEIAEEGVNVFITGITALNDYSRKAHKFAKENRINIIGATHYSTEKFACLAMCDYFKNLGLPCEFIEDKPILEDLE